MMLPLTAALALVLTAGATEPSEARDGPTFDEGVVPEEVLQAAIDARDLPLGERMERISRPMLGMPYLVDAIGEGTEPDVDPPARYDVYDCLTFVEEVLALAMPADPRSAPMIRSQLRYTNGEPGYSSRRHFMLEQWIPENIASGWLKDITAEFGETHLIEKQVTPRTWAAWKHRRKFQLTDSQLPTGHYTLPVLSLDAAIAAADQIPPGALILTVRRSRDHIPIVVTHVGFVIPSDSEPRMRHATKMGRRVVRDERLAWYFDHVRWYDWWQVEGISILMPQEIGPRMSRLPATPAE